MLFRLLGPLEVSEGDHPLPVGEGRQRSVLVLLLLHRNEAVSSERLIDSLWGEAPPATAAKVLQNYVGQLRRALADREGQRLQTRGRGYVLAGGGRRAGRGSFRALVNEGGEALARERPADAAARLREASRSGAGRHWPTSPTKRSRSPRSSGSKSVTPTALEQRIDADLALGHHAEVVAELEGLVAEHPLRERLRGQLMVALYRCGRQADALEVCDARGVLLDELGVEPGPELRELQVAILRQDAGLAPAPTRGRARCGRPAPGSRCWPSAAPYWPARPSRRRWSPDATRRSGPARGGHRGRDRPRPAR